MPSHDQTAFEWEPPAELIESSILTQFIRRTGLANLGELRAQADRDPAWLTQEVLDFCDFRFFDKYRQILDDSRGIEHARWCVGGTTNIVLNCIDRHRDTSIWQKTYMVWEGEASTERRSLTYEQLNDEVCRLANALRALDVARGDRIALYMPNVPEAIVGFFAAIKIGAVVVPLFTGFGPEALTSRLTDAGVKVVLTVDVAHRRGKLEAMKRTLDDALAHCPDVRSVLVYRRQEGSAACPMLPGRDHDWSRLVQGQSTSIETAHMNSEDPAILFYTSGTTGKPKGCVWTHVSFLGSMVTRDMHICCDFRSSDRLFFLSDMGWMVGAMCACIPSYFGASVLLAEGAPDYPQRGRFWRLIQDNGVTYLGVAPTLVRSFMRDSDDQIDQFDLSSLRITVSAGEPWTEVPWHWFFENVCKRKVPLLNIVGGTEIGGCNFVGTLHHPLLPGSFGMPGLGVGVDVVDASGTSVTKGQIGDLVLRNPNIGMTKSLWKDDARYIESYWSTFPGRWFHGDLALCDENDLYYVLGRSDDIIKVSGKRTGPAEIENALLATGLVSEAAVVGVPDNIKGSSIAAVCVPRAQVVVDDVLRRSLSEAVVAAMGSSYRPQQLVFVLDIPKTRNLKIMRRVVRATLCGLPPGDLSSLTNPESVSELQTVAAQLWKSSAIPRER